MDLQNTGITSNSITLIHDLLSVNEVLECLSLDQNPFLDPKFINYVNDTLERRNPRRILKAKINVTKRKTSNPKTSGTRTGLKVNIYSRLKHVKRGVPWRVEGRLIERKEGLPVGTVPFLLDEMKDCKANGKQTSTERDTEAGINLYTIRKVLCHYKDKWKGEKKHRLKVERKMRRLEKKLKHYEEAVEGSYILDENTFMHIEKCFYKFHRLLIQLQKAGYQPENEAHNTNVGEIYDEYMSINVSKRQMRNQHSIRPTSGSIRRSNQRSRQSLEKHSGKTNSTLGTHSTSYINSKSKSTHRNIHKTTTPIHSSGTSSTEGIFLTNQDDMKGRTSKHNRNSSKKGKQREFFLDQRKVDTDIELVKESDGLTDMKKNAKLSKEVFNNHSHESLSHSDKSDRFSQRYEPEVKTSSSLSYSNEKSSKFEIRYESEVNASPFHTHSKEKSNRYSESYEDDISERQNKEISGDISSNQSINYNKQEVCNSNENNIISGSTGDIDTSSNQTSKSSKHPYLRKNGCDVQISLKPKESPISPEQVSKNNTQSLMKSNLTDKMNKIIKNPGNSSNARLEMERNYMSENTGIDVDVKNYSQISSGKDSNPIREVIPSNLINREIKIDKNEIENVNDGSKLKGEEENYFPSDCSNSRHMSISNCLEESLQQFDIGASSQSQFNSLGKEKHLSQKEDKYSSSDFESEDPLEF